MKFPFIALEQSRINPTTGIVHAMITEHDTLCGLGPPGCSPFTRFKETAQKVTCAKCNKLINAYYEKLYADELDIESHNL